MSSSCISKSWFNVSIVHEPGLKPLDPKSYVDSAKLRSRLKGDRNLYLAHFREAFNHDQDVLQIALTLAFAATSQENDWGRACIDPSIKRANCRYEEIKKWYEMILSEAFPRIRYSSLICGDFFEKALRAGVEAGFGEAIYAQQFYRLADGEEEFIQLDPKTYEDSSILSAALNGDQNLYQRHFREAVRSNNFVLQIALAISFGALNKERNYDINCYNVIVNSSYSKIKKNYIEIFSKAFPQMQLSDLLIGNFCDEAFKGAQNVEFLEAVCVQQ